MFDNKREISTWLKTDVLPWTNELVCKVLELSAAPGAAPVYLLAAILAAMRELQFGNRFYNIVPRTLGTEPVLVLDEQPQGHARKVKVWIDTASGGPLPTIRISTGASSTSSGGIRVAAGGSEELGLVPAKTRLYAASSSATTVMYVVEYG